uniref:Uncharacterized protein n=1 Tax=Heterorhabditis bacteriophora TaxID=37862 RepID=A0A1I7WJX5_HETBA
MGSYYLQKTISPPILCGRKFWSVHAIPSGWLSKGLLKPEEIRKFKSTKKVAAGSRIPAWDTVRAVLLSLLNFRKSAVMVLRCR